MSKYYVLIQERLSGEDIPDFTDHSFLLIAAEESVFACNLGLYLDAQGRKCIGFAKEASRHVNSSTMEAPNNKLARSHLLFADTH